MARVRETITYNQAFQAEKIIGVAKPIAVVDPSKLQRYARMQRKGLITAFTGAVKSLVEDPAVESGDIGRKLKLEVGEGSDKTTLAIETRAPHDREVRTRVGSLIGTEHVRSSNALAITAPVAVKHGIHAGFLQQQIGFGVEELENNLGEVEGVNIWGSYAVEIPEELTLAMGDGEEVTIDLREKGDRAIWQDFSYMADPAERQAFGVGIELLRALPPDALVTTA